MLNYITNFYMAWCKEHKDKEKLPPIFPLLLYNGEAISVFFNWFRQLAIHKRLKAEDFVSLSEAYRFTGLTEEELTEIFTSAPHEDATH